MDVTWVITVVVLVVSVAYAAPKVVASRRVARAKRRVLRQALGRRIILTVGPPGANARRRKRIGGVLQKVDRWGITVDTGGSLDRIALRGIRTVKDDRGSSLGAW